MSEDKQDVKQKPSFLNNKRLNTIMQSFVMRRLIEMETNCLKNEYSGEGIFYYILL